MVDANVRKMWERMEYLKLHPEKEPKEEKIPQELVKKVAEIIIKTNNPSMLLIQRKLKLGFYEVSKIFTVLENMGIVSDFQGDGKPRKILVNKI